MLIYVNITDRQTHIRRDIQTHQKYISEPHKTVILYENRSYFRSERLQEILIIVSFLLI